MDGRGSWWRVAAVAAVGGALAVAAAVVPSAQRGAAHTLVWASATVVTVLACRVLRPQVPAPWWLFVTGLGLGTASTVAWWQSGSGPQPSLADALQVLANLVIAAAAVGFFAWHGPRPALARRVQVVAGLTVFVLANAGLVGLLAGRTVVDRSGAVSLVLAELLVAALVFAVIEARRRRNASAWMMTGALVVGIAGNALLVVAGEPGGTPRWPELLWLSAVVLGAAASVHADMRSLPAEPDDAGEARSFRRVLPLGGLVLVPALVPPVGLLLGVPAPALVALLYLGIAGAFLWTVRLLLDRDRAAQLHIENEFLLRSLLSSTGDAVMVVDRAGGLRWSGGNTRMFRDRLLPGAPVADLIVARDRPLLASAVERVRDAAVGTERLEVEGAAGRDWFEIQVRRHLSVVPATVRAPGATSPVAFPVGGVVLWWRDLSEQRRRLHEAARDPLTGLANRAVFEEVLREALRHADETVAVMFIDLDGFKAVNDTYGHQVGDVVLETAARRLEAQVRAGDLVARFGGDEFALVCRDLPRPGAAAELGDRIHRSLREPFTVQGEVHRVGCSVGVALRWSDDDPGGERQLERADAAMYRAKRTGVGVVVARPTPRPRSEEVPTG